MDPARLYDYLTRSRARVLGWVGPLSVEQYDQRFPIGAGSIARILNHTLIAEWYYVVRMLEQPTPPTDEMIAREADPPAFPELEREWAEQADSTRAAIRTISDWARRIEYTVEDDDGNLRRVVATPGDIFMQLVLHEVHHRAQVLNILRGLGVQTEDIDYNLFMYDISRA